MSSIGSPGTSDRRLTIQTAARDLVAQWFESNVGHSIVGVPNIGLLVLEHFRAAAPLEESDYLAPSRAQVKGMSGTNAYKIIVRFLPSATPLGTESGRTSRGTSDRARRLAQALNALFERFESLSDDERSLVADEGQAWIVDNPIRAYYARQRVTPELNPAWSAPRNIRAILDAAGDRRGPVAQHLVGAKLALRFPDHNVPVHTYSTADVQTGRAGDFQIGDSAFHVTVAPGAPLMEKCQQNVRDGLRVTVIVTEEVRAAAAQLVAVQNLADFVAVTTVESFVGQNVDELAEFSSDSYRLRFGDLLRTYNERVSAAEPDQSLQIKVPPRFDGS